MPPAGLERAIPASERPQTHALDRAEFIIRTKILLAINLPTEEGALPKPFEFLRTTCWPSLAYRTNPQTLLPTTSFTPYSGYVL
jgi:hypothetical protein